MKKCGIASLRRVAAERIEIGERMLRDRACGAGGWNYGGSNVYGQELFPYVPTTALGLLAMQDHPGDPIVARALAWLSEGGGGVLERWPWRIALLACRASARRRPPVLADRRGTIRVTDGMLGLATASMRWQVAYWEAASHVTDVPAGSGHARAA